MTNGLGGARQVLGASVRGAVHRRDGRPNQDAVAWAGPIGSDGRLVAAVSDGHGSHKAFRSQTGARLAVEVSVDAGTAFVERLDPANPLAFDERTWAPLTREVVDRWTRAVRADLGVDPLRDGELSALAELEGPLSREAIEADPMHAYGATLLVAAAVGSMAVFLQLGDGDILLAPEWGPVTRPLADDPRLFANETTSLCMADADQEFRFGCQPLTGEAAQVALLATDGLVNAYQDDASFLKVAADLQARISAIGLDAVGSQLEGFLDEASAHSGDDVTVAILWLGAAHGADPTNVHRSTNR